MTPYIIYFIAKFTNLSCTPYYLLHRLLVIDFDLPLWEPKVPCLNPRNDISWFVFYQLTHVYFAVSYHKTETYICSFSFDSPQPFLATETSGRWTCPWTPCRHGPNPAHDEPKVGPVKLAKGGCYVRDSTKMNLSVAKIEKYLAKWR